MNFTTSSVALQLFIRSFLCTFCSATINSCSGEFFFYFVFSACFVVIAIFVVSPFLFLAVAPVVGRRFLTTATIRCPSHRRRNKNTRLLLRTHVHNYLFNHPSIGTRVQTQNDSLFSRVSFSRFPSCLFSPTITLPHVWSSLTIQQSIQVVFDRSYCWYRS